MLPINEDEWGDSDIAGFSSPVALDLTQFSKSYSNLVKLILSSALVNSPATASGQFFVIVIRKIFFQIQGRIVCILHPLALSL